MELRQLRYFVVVAEELHFGRAAQRLHLAQQSLSFQIKQLERELGIMLFERTTRHVKLTLAGEIFLKEVLMIFEDLEAAVEKAQRAGRGETGRLVVGYHSTTLYTLMPLTVRLFRERYPDVEVVLQEMMPRALDENILNGRIDIGFSGFLEHPHPELAYEITYRDPLAVVFPKGHRFEHDDTIPWAALSDEPFVMYSRSQKPEAFDQIIALCQRVGFSPHSVQEASNETAVISLVATGVGVAIATMGLRHIRANEVGYRPLIDPAINISFVIVWKPHNPAPLVKSFVQTAQEVVQRNLNNCFDPENSSNSQ
jgi:DNA-binding transcriptional LysR family regulator